MSSALRENRSELAEKINEYLVFLQEKEASPLTIRNYRHYLKRLLKFIEIKTSRPHLSDISSSLIAQFRDSLLKMGLSNKTLSYHLIAARSFLKWLRKKGFDTLSLESIEIPKTESRELQFLTGEEVDKLLNAPSLSTIQGLRDKAILEVFYSTGLRVSDLTALNKNSINIERRELKILGKKGKSRVVFLSARALEWTEKYLGSRKDNFGPLFIRHKGKMDPSFPDEKMRLTPRSVQRMIKKYVRKMKLPQDTSPKVLRHSFATDLLMAGADIRSVQEMLGHKNISTTQIYTHVTNKQLRDIHAAFHGKGGN